jgi:hypothetical protein
MEPTSLGATAKPLSPRSVINMVTRRDEPPEPRRVEPTADVSFDVESEVSGGLSN